MEEASSILAFSTMRVTNKKPQNTLNQKTDSREPPILLRDLRLFKWSLKWTCGVSSNTSLALCPSPNQLQMHYNWYLNNYKGEGWCWASFPSLPIADLRCYLQGVNKPARSLGHPSVISNSCSETLPVPIFLPMYLLIRSQASRQGGGFSLKLKGALCMVCVGRETEIHLSRSHLFHENWTFREERYNLATRIIKTVTAVTHQITHKKYWLVSNLSTK